MSVATDSKYIGAKAPQTLTPHAYMKLYLESINNPDGFWLRESSRISWSKPFITVKNTSFIQGKVSIKWFEEGELNASVNCIDRHLPKHADKAAFHWEPDTPGFGRTISYQQLHDETCRLANALKNLGVNKGDRVAVYLPMIPEAIFSMLACARIGAIHCVIFAGYSAHAIADRVSGCGAKLIITASEGRRGGQRLLLKQNVDLALTLLGQSPVANSTVESVLVLNNSDADIEMGELDSDYAELVAEQASTCIPVPMNAEDPLFILYTSGSTGEPKGVLHSTGGYLVYASITHQYIFDLHPSDTFWCSADIGWITGHTYIVYGPLANGVTSVLFEGAPNYPTVGRYGEIIDKYAVNTFYVAPTAIRALMARGDEATASSQRSSLNLLATAGEPINPAAWHWFNDQFGNGHCQILDTWWQTETGGIMISPMPGATPLKPGSATRPFFGIKPALVDIDGKLLAGRAEGALVMLDSWPGQMRTVYGNHAHFEQTYFSMFEGMYFSGDRARMDEDGYFWITGRMDDVLNVAGRRLGTAEIESCLIAHPSIVEAAVVGFPHDLKGQGIYVFVTPANHVRASAELADELIRKIRDEFSPVAIPDQIQWTTGLPRTRSGKIMRRILRRIACDEEESLGDLSALADPGLVDEIIAQHKLL